MVPNAELIEKWAEDMGDGWTRLPTSCIDGLLFVLREAEKLEGRGQTGVAAALAAAERDTLRAALERIEHEARDQVDLHTLVIGAHFAFLADLARAALHAAFTGKEGEVDEG